LNLIPLNEELGMYSGPRPTITLLTPLLLILSGAGESSAHKVRYGPLTTHLKRDENVT